MRTTLAVVAVLVLVLGVGAGLAVSADKAKPVTGEITAIDTEKATITVADKVYNVKEAKITVDGSESKVGDLKVGMKAKLTLDGEKVTAVEVKAAAKKKKE